MKTTYRYAWPASALTADDMARLYAVREGSRAHAHHAVDRSGRPTGLRANARHSIPATRPELKEAT